MPSPWDSGCHLHRALGDIPMELRVPSLWSSGCHAQGALGAFIAGHWVPSPRVSGCLHRRALGAIPMEVWVPSPRGSECHPHWALGAFITGPWVPSLWGSGCHPPGHAAPVTEGDKPALAGAQGSGPGAARGVSGAFPPLPALSPCQVPGPSTVGTAPRPPWGPKGLWGLPWLRGAAHPSGCDPKGCQRCSMAQTTGPGGDAHLRAPSGHRDRPLAVTLRATGDT